MHYVRITYSAGVSSPFVVCPPVPDIVSLHVAGAAALSNSLTSLGTVVSLFPFIVDVVVFAFLAAFSFFS